MTWPKDACYKGAQTPERMEEIRQRKKEKEALRNSMTVEEWEAHLDAQDKKPSPSFRFQRSTKRLLDLHPDRLEDFKPRNGYDDLVKQMIKATKMGKEGQIVVQVFKVLQEMLEGGKPAKLSAKEERQNEMPKIVNDLPMAIHKPDEVN